MELVRKNSKRFFVLKEETTVVSCQLSVYKGHIYLIEYSSDNKKKMGDIDGAFNHISPRLEVLHKCYLI